MNTSLPHTAGTARSARPPTAPPARRGLFAPLNPPITDWRGRRVWLVGASSGIGEACAEALYRRGAQVLLSARKAEALQTFVDAHPPRDGALLDLYRPHSRLLFLADRCNQRHDFRNVVPSGKGLGNPMHEESRDRRALAVELALPAGVGFGL